VSEIPDYQTLMLPILKIAAGGESSIPKAVEKLGAEFNLTPQQMAEMLPSGGIQVVNNRAHWAKTYLVKAGLLDQPRRGVFRITERGSGLLNQNPTRIDNQLLSKYSEFRAFTKQRQTTFDETAKLAKDSSSVIAPIPPNERIAAAAKRAERRSS
jgi:restriction system protein